MWSLKALGAAGLAIVMVVTCGPEGASNISQIQDLIGEACTEGEARDTVLYVKNLNDFEWQGTRLTVAKGGKDYMLGSQGGHVDDSRWVLIDMPPDSVSKTGPFTDPSKFTTRGRGPVPNNPNYMRPLLRLGSFNHLESASVVIAKPFEAEWTGTVPPCK